MMIDHITINVSDFPASRKFFSRALAPLGITLEEDAGDACGFGSKGDGRFWIAEGERHVPMHIAFSAQTQQQVQAFYFAALESGGRDNGAPGLRAQYGPDYYAAFVYGPDGHNIEAVCRAPQN